MSQDPILDKLDLITSDIGISYRDSGSLSRCRQKLRALLAEVAIEYAGVALVGYDLEREDIRKRFGVAPPNE